MFNKKKELICQENLLEFRDHLYDYQKEAVDAVSMSVSNAKERMIGQIILPTGAGKTKIAEYVTAYLLNAIYDAENRPSVFGIACHRLVLADNLLTRIIGTLTESMLYNKLKFIVINSGSYEKFSTDFVKKYYPDQQARDVLKYEREIKVKDQAEAWIKQGYSVVFIMLYQSLDKVLRSNINFDFLFCDEAHTAVEKNIFPNMKSLVKTSSVTIHMTATPAFKSNGQDMSDEKTYGTVIYGKEPRELVVSKHIVPLNMVLLQTLDKNDEIKSRGQMFATPAAVIDAIQTAAISLFEKVKQNQMNAGTPEAEMKNGVLFGRISGNKHLGEILHPTTKAAKKFKDWRKANDVDLYLISAEKGGCIDYCDTAFFDETGKDKGQFLEKLMEIGKTRKNKAIILNIDMLSEGIDLPEINGVIICSAIENPAKLLQIIGRSVRRDDYDRRFIEDVSIKWNEFEKFRKPVSYVYVPTVVNDEAEMKGIVNILEKIYAAYGDINFTTTSIEYHDGTSKKINDNPDQNEELTNEEKATGKFGKLKHKLIEQSLMGLCKSAEYKHEYVTQSIAMIYQKAKKTGDSSPLQRLQMICKGDWSKEDALYNHIVEEAGEMLVV